MDREQLIVEIYDRVSKAYNWLFNSGIRSGHWNEVRSTALVGLCLKLREPLNSPWLESVKNWLLRQQKPFGGDMASWGEELWDTSTALLALKSLGVPPKAPQYQRAVNWVMHLYNESGRNNWSDEPWETFWSLLAVFEAQPEGWPDITLKATNWLLSLQDSGGRIIAPHYTAYFVLVAYKLLNDNPVLSPQEKSEFSTAVTKAVQYLIEVINEETLWTGEAWSNGQILWILSMTGQFPFSNDEILQKVVHWFFREQKENGWWSGVEDTASAILGLLSLAKNLESISDIELQKRLSILLKTPTLCLRRRLVVREEDGYISINISPNLQKIIAILLGIASTATTIIALWDRVVTLFDR